MCFKESLTTCVDDAISWVREKIVVVNSKLNKIETFRIMMQNLLEIFCENLLEKSSLPGDIPTSQGGRESPRDIRRVRMYVNHLQNFH